MIDTTINKATIQRKESIEERYREFAKHDDPNRYLTKGEVYKIRHYHLESSNLSWTRAIFILSLRTGKRYEDVVGFLPENTKYHFSLQKTNAFLKEIAAICDIDKKVTFHMARRTHMRYKYDESWKIIFEYPC